ncbi:uncharacterized protein EDB91DRAFT_1227796 [Suillus paluster]|uniref:uncharacterized protein n=1 Tax=Suillus paluster TaxID=48578 RepID=UPI001B86CB8A|nr:uncharacterized protein EDB91DRAFT_1227796 [Suillus paluster]KAG1729965.1 hypothetical protein EDB91DRAFT_1227796 [Suillus paluster]
MIYNFIKNVVNSLLGYSKELLDRQMDQIESCTHGDPHSRQLKAPVPPTPPLTPPSHRLSNTDAPLSSMMDQEPPISCGTMPARIGRATLEDIPEELRCHILSFLSSTAILRCALTCRSMYNTVKLSVKLQYIIELDVQRLIQVHPRPHTVSTAECLRTLRDKANAWNSFELDVTKATSLRFPHICNSNSITHHQLNLSNWSIDADAESHAVDINTYTACAGSRWLNLNGPNSGFRALFYMEQSQDLMVMIQFPIDGRTYDFKYKILFCTISTGEEHPLAHGSRVVAGRPACGEAQKLDVAVSVLGNRIVVCLAEHGDSYWSLHVSNWHQGGTSDDVYVTSEGYGLCDIRFLTKEKLLALSTDGHIHLYDIEDLSKTPRLQARFILPVHKDSGTFVLPEVYHSAQGCARLKSPDDTWIWTTNPADRVISVVWSCPSSIFVISARVFFMDIPLAWFDVTSKDGLSVPWSSWGPQNSRCFDGEDVLSFGVGGSRVIRAVPFLDRNYSTFRLHMTDFNPSAVARGIGKVVREPTTTALDSDVPITTYLPFVEAIHDQCLDASLWSIVLDEERMVILTKVTAESVSKISLLSSQ